MWQRGVPSCTPAFPSATQSPKSLAQVNHCPQELPAESHCRWADRSHLALGLELGGCAGGWDRSPRKLLGVPACLAKPSGPLNPHLSNAVCTYPAWLTRRDKCGRSGVGKPSVGKVELH